MKKNGKELEFISLIKRDGSGTIAVGTSWDANSDHAKTDDVNYMNDLTFNLIPLSLTNKTFIATNFNAWVVRLKKT